MKNKKLLQILIDLGLSENEESVYLAALSLGPTTILKIAKTAEMKRTTIYSVIDSLKKRGLINIEIKGFKTLFTAENPEKLETMLDSHREQLRNSLPEFLGMYNLKGGESSIKYYEGLESVKSVYESLISDIKPHEDYLIIADAKQWMELDPEYFQNFTERRAKLNINTRMLLQDSKTARELKNKEKNYNIKGVKIFPQKMSLTTNIVIIPKKIVIHQLTPPIMAVVIENKSMINMQKEIFEIIWNSLKA